MNGKGLDEPYVADNSPLQDPIPGQECRARKFVKLTVQPGHVFVMGDHRGVSQDSRCNGQVPIDKIIGRAFVIAWPVGRWDSLSVPKTFSEVPKLNALRLEPRRVAMAPLGMGLLIPSMAVSVHTARRRGRRLPW